MSAEEPAQEASPKAGGAASGGKDVAVAAGRGAAALAIAKLYFVFAGWVVYLFLPRILSEQQWGDYLVVIGVASVINNVMVGGTIQAISRFTAAGAGSPAQVRWAGIRMQGLLGTGGALLLASAGAVLSLWWSDVGLWPLFALMGLMAFFYSMYAVFVGSANGQRKFVHQAGLDMGYATSKVVLVLTGAALFAKAGGRLGVAGALGGLVTASALILAVSVLVVGPPSRKRPGVSVRPLASFALALFFYTFLLNLLMQTDRFLMKRFGLELAPSGVGGAEFASRLAGLYGMGQLFAFIIYQVLMSLSFVVFPLVSKSTADEDQETTQRYIRQALRVGLLVAGGLAAVLSSRAAEVIVAVQPARYAIAGYALRPLAWGMVGLTILVIGCTVLNGAGKTRKAIYAVSATLGLAIVLDVVALKSSQTEAQALARTGLATAVAMGLGAGAMGWILWREFRAHVSWVSLGRIMLATGVTFGLGLVVPWKGRFVTVLVCGALLLLYGLLLVASRELGPADLALVSGLLRRGKGAGKQ